jgi:hypothetical protein
LLLALSLWEVTASLRAGSDTGSEADWTAAAARVRREFRPGELIVVAPAWADPVGRRYLGDLISVDSAARMDAARYATIWELSIRGASAADTRTARVQWSEQFGAVTVRKFSQQPVVVLTDFVDAFAGARVAGRVVRHSRDRSVPPGPALEEVGFAPHRCVRIVPQPGSSVTVTYPAVRLGSALVGYVGLADVFTRRDSREPARLAVQIDGVAAAATEVGVDDGWVRFEAATAPAEAAEVVFTATAIGPAARDRLICFAAEARR